MSEPLQENVKHAFEGVVDAVLAGSPHGAALFDHRLRLARVNARMRAVLPALVEGNIGRPLSELASRLAPLVHRLLETGGAIVRRPLDLGGEGAARTVDVSGAAVAWSADGGRAALLFIEDPGPSRAEQHLGRSEAPFAKAELLAGIGFWQWDVVRDEVSWTEALSQIYGGDRPFRGSYDEYLKQLPVEERARVDATVRHCLATGNPYHLEHRIVTPAGEERIAEAHACIERDAQGRATRIVGTLLDVTERKRATQAVRDQQLFLDAIIENLPNMIFVKDAKELRFVRLNRAGEELLGYARQDLIGRSDYDFFTREEADRFTAQDRKVLQSGQVLDCPEDTIHTRAKGVRVLQSKKVPILDEHGEPAYLLGISEDITERERAEAFRLSDLLVQSMADYAIFLLDADGRVKTWNGGAERVTGYQAEEIIGSSAAILRPAGNRDTYGRLLDEARAHGHVVEEGLWVRKDGRRIWRVTGVTAIRDEAGAVTLFGTVTRDISQRKEAEDERERLLAQLREALRLRDEFLSVASHELRTPVTTLKLQADLLEQLAALPPAELAGRLPSFAERLSRQADRLARHVDGLLDVTRLTSGRVQLQLGEHDLAQIVETTVNRLREELRAGPVIHLRIVERVIGCWDALRVEQVLTNLLSNAVKYGLGRPIEVQVERIDGQAQLTVRDHGIGIAAADQERIFQQFERAVSERNYGGLGLGLFIVRQIVEAMHGRIEVSSRPGEGAAFVVRLPPWACGQPS